ncbi:MAG: peptide-methionine (S)-S-oxide reductase, partial [Trebonia sp.]|nr:peptide-methionine (S)-S-oxide reductase [Trebonia sp.]MDX6418687.1 peptide-methionine (S)-S-oxide reductase [Trebonia sp.]
GRLWAARCHNHPADRPCNGERGCRPRGNRAGRVRAGEGVLSAAAEGVLGVTRRGYGSITTDIAPASEFYFAEDYHQQYLYKVPHGYCPDHSTGVSCPVGLKLD